MDPTQVANKAQEVVHAVEAAVVGKTDTVNLCVAVLLAGGHLLIEDIPGVGKTTLAKAISKALGLQFKRIQFTPDLLPSDITGSSIFNQKSGEFELRKGPVFASVVLADEINRTTPKTQSALLECMEEHQVTIDGEPCELPTPFLVIATQNNIEMSGTYPLPEAQLDRFMARLTLGYPDRSAEAKILDGQQHTHPVDRIESVTDADEVTRMQHEVRDVHVEESVRNYLLDIISGTRLHPSLLLGSSPRGALSLMHLSQATAAMDGREYVKPDDIKRLAPAVLSHRVIIRPEQRVRGVTASACIQEILSSVNVPAGQTAR